MKIPKWVVIGLSFLFTTGLAQIAGAANISDCVRVVIGGVVSELNQAVPGAPFDSASQCFVAPTALREAEIEEFHLQFGFSF